MLANLFGLVRRSACPATLAASLPGGGRPLRVIRAAVASVELLEARHLLSTANAAPIYPEADAYVRDGYHANTNFGNSPNIEVKHDTDNDSQSTNNYRNGFLRFDLSSISSAPDGVTSAKLRLYPISFSGIGRVRLQLIADSSWVEGNGGTDNSPTGEVTFNSRPIAVAGAPAPTYPSPVAGQVQEFDLTPWVQQAMSAGGAKKMSVRVFFKAVTSSPYDESNPFAVYASRENSNAALRPQLLIETADAPADPTDLQATAASSSEVKLHWTDNSSDEIGFTIERSTDNFVTSVALDVPADATDFTDAGLRGNTPYRYRVLARGNGNLSAFSNEVVATTPIVAGGLYDLAASADAFVQGGDAGTINFGNATSLVVKGSDNPKYRREAFLRFDLDTIVGGSSSIKRSVLQLHPTSASSGTGGYLLDLIDDDSWIEGDGGADNSPTGEIVFNNKPSTTAGRPALYGWTTETAGTTRELELTQIVRDELSRDSQKKLSLKLSVNNQDGLTTANYGSNEKFDSSLRPRLQIATGAVWDGGGTSMLWSDSANWLGDAVPQAGDVYIGATSAPVVYDGATALNLRSLRVDSGLNVSGGNLNVSTVVEINGALSITGGTLKSTGVWRSKGGSVSVSGGVLDLGGTTTTAGLGLAGWSRPGGGGEVRITGTLDNAGSTLALDGMTTGTWELAGGTIAGGRVEWANGATLAVPQGTASYDGTLDGVTLGSDLTLDPNVELLVKGGLTLDAATLAVPSGSVHFIGAQSIGGTGQVALGGAGGTGVGNLYPRRASDDGRLTVGADVTIRGRGGVYNYTSYGASYGGPLTNLGTIVAGDAAGGTLSFYVPTTNGGTIRAGGAGVGAGARLNLSSASFVNDGTLRASAATIASTASAFTNANLIEAIFGSTVTIGGTSFLNESLGIIDIYDTSTVSITATNQVDNGTTNNHP